MGGGNESENLVDLTAREHFICHWLLHMDDLTNQKLARAFSMMCLMKTEKQYRYTPSSRIFEYAKKIISECHRNRKDSEETLQKKRNFMTKYFSDPENRKKKSTEQLIPSVAKRKRDAMNEIWSNADNRQRQREITINAMMQKDGLIEYCKRIGAEVAKTKEWQDKVKMGTVAAMARPEIKAKMCKPRAKASCIKCKQIFGTSGLRQHQNKCFQ
jgi:hypothetical protein